MKRKATSSEGAPKVKGSSYVCPGLGGRGEQTTMYSVKSKHPLCSFSLLAFYSSVLFPCLIHHVTENNPSRIRNGISRVEKDILSDS